MSKAIETRPQWTAVPKLDDEIRETSMRLGQISVGRNKHELLADLIVNGMIWHDQGLSSAEAFAQALNTLEDSSGG